MVSVLSPVSTMTAADFRRVTDVTYLGYVFGTMSALRRMVPRNHGVVVQIGIAGGEMTLPMNMAVAKEIELRGTFRFHAEFALAVALIGGGLVDVMPLLTETVPLEDARAAFELAADRSRAMKVQLAFT